MTDRSVVARLRAEASQFLATMAKAAKSTEQVGTSADKASKQATGAFDRMAKSIRANDEHINRLGNTALLAGGAITAGLGLGVKAFADFDEAMSSVNAALPEAGASMEKLRLLAIDLGKDTSFSSTEAAQGITELGKAGLDAEAILSGGLKGSLDLAAAGQLDVARAAEVSATALKQFNLEGSELGHVADLYAAAAGKAQGSVEDIAQAMKFAGITANGLGIDIDETVGTLGLFAEAGIIGEQAGTGLRSLLLSLSSPSQIAAKAMNDLGISVYDASGNFVGIGGAAEELKNKLGPLDEATRNAALGQIFGNESINAARLLYEGGAAAVVKWTGNVNDAGFAAEQAAALTDNLKGDVERLGGALDAVFVQNGEGANGVLRDLVQSTEGAVEAFGALPQPVQQGAFALAGLTGATLLVGGALAKAATTSADMLESMEALRTKSPKVARGLDLTATAARGAAAAFAILKAADLLQDDGDDIPLDDFTNQLLKSGDAVTVLDAAIKKMGERTLETDSKVTDFGSALATAFDPNLLERAQGKVTGFLETATGGFVHLNSEAGDAAEVLALMDSSLAGLVGSGNADVAADLLDQYAAAAAASGVSTEELLTKLPGYTEALAAADTQQQLAGESAAGMAGDLDEVKSSAERADTAVDDLAEAIRGFGDTAISADEARAAFEESVDAVTERLEKRTELQKELNEELRKEGEERDPEAIAKLRADLEDYNLTLDITTKAGRENRDLLVNMAERTKELSATTLEQTGSTEKAAAAMNVGREAFVKAADQLGYTKGEAEKLADAYGLLPDSVTTIITASGVQSAREKVQALITAVELLNRTDASIGVRYVYTGIRPNGGRSTAGGLSIDADGAMHVQSATGLVKAYAQGGVHTVGQAQPQIAKAGGKGILWAEEGAGPWEAFISGHPAKRVRSRSIAADTVERLGGRVEWRRFADGGMFGAGAPGAVTRQTTHNQPVIVQHLSVADYDDFRIREQDARAVDNLGGGL